jgi:hypothetical protein
VDALPHNTHLRTLDCRGNDMTELFARDRLLPAVRANTSLRTLNAARNSENNASAREAEVLVRARAVADAV